MAVVTSTIVEALGPGVGPSSTIAATWSPSIRSASSAPWSRPVHPVVLAELTASGPVRSRISRVRSWSGIRTATVPRVSPRSQRREDCWRATIVRGPGQKRSMSARA